MAKDRTKRNGDVSWYVPGLKRAIAYSTVAEKLDVEVLASEGFNTPRKILELAKKESYVIKPYTVSCGVADIMKAFVDKGFGDLVLG